MNKAMLKCLQGYGPNHSRLLFTGESANNTLEKNINGIQTAESPKEKEKI